MRGLSQKRRAAGARAYQSALRDDQARQTRERIIDGLVAVLNETPNDVSIPRVAAKARVAVPTVYRHFPSKAALHAGLQARVDAELRRGGGWPEFSTDAAGFAAGVRELFVRFAGLDESLRNIGATRMAVEGRRKRLAARMEWIDSCLAEPLSRLPPRERTLMRDVLAIMVSSSGLRAFEDYLGLTASEAADRVEWTIHALVRATEARRAKGGTR